jgi:PilZ domain
MRSEKRKAPRKTMRYSAWLHVGRSHPIGCRVADISHTGARLDVEAPQDVPDRCILLLLENGRPRRTCRTIWRTSSQIGVQFERPTDRSADPD